MNKIAVLYKSKYGTTKQYAEWIAEETCGTLFKLPKIDLSELSDYDTIIVGGGVYAGGMLGFKFLKKHFTQLSGKKIIVFSVGASFNNEKNINEIRKHNLTPEMASKIQFFHLRGGLDYPNMKWLDRTLMGMMIGMLKKKPEEQKDEETRGMIETYGKNVSFLDRKSIGPIVAAAKS